MDDFVLILEDNLTKKIGERVMLIDNQNNVDPLRSVKMVIDIQENQI